jgi:hypothetical protein
MADKEAKQASSPHRSTNLSLTDSCLVPVPLISMEPMVYMSKDQAWFVTGRKFSTGQMVEVY